LRKYMDWLCSLRLILMISLHYFPPWPIRIFSPASIDYRHDEVLDYYEERWSWITLLHDYKALYLHTQDLFMNLSFAYYAIITTTTLISTS
jgi:hypothetical protein